MAGTVTCAARLALLVVLAAPAGVSAQDSSSGFLTYSRAGSVVRVAEEEKAAHAFWYHAEPRFALRLDVAVPLDEETRRAALIRRSSLATGFLGYLFLGYTNVTDGAPPASRRGRREPDARAGDPAAAESPVGPDVAGDEEPESGFIDSEDGLQIEPIENWHPVFFELGGEVAASYDRYELRRPTDLIAAAQWEESFAVDVGVRFFGFRQLSADITTAWVIRAGGRGSRTFDTKPSELCLPVATGSGTGERCDNVTVLDGDITSGVTAYARAFFSMLFRVGGNNEASLGFTLGLESLNLAEGRSVAVSYSAWAFVAPRLSVTALFGVGLEVTHTEETGAVQVVPSIVVGGALPWQDQGS